MDSENSVRLAEALRAVFLLLQHQVARHLEPANLSPARFRVIAALREGGPQRMSEVSARVGIAARSLTDVVVPLERDGLLVRRPDPADRRAVVVEVTAAGVELHDRLKGRFADAVAELMSVLTDTETTELAQLLGAVLDRRPGGCPFSPPPADPSALAAQPPA